MAKESVSPDTKLKKLMKEEIIFQIKHKDLMNEKHIKLNRILNYFKHFLIFIFAVSDSVSISAFVPLVSVPVGIASSTVGLKICALTAGIKNYKSIIKKKKIHDKIVLLA